MIFYETFKWYMHKEEEFKINFSEVFAVIWETYCSAEVRREIKEMLDWDQGVDKIRDNPLKLLERVENLKHTPERAKYPVLTIIKVLWNFLRTKQSDSEDLLDYLSHFKSERDVVFCLLGKNFLDEFSKVLPEYAALGTDNEQEKFKRMS